MLTKFGVFRRKDADLSLEAGTVAKIFRVVDETMSAEMGGGYFRVDGTSTERELPYNELALCLEGKMTLKVDGTIHELQPGDFAWIPKGTFVTFGGENAIAFYAVHPVDWRTRG